MGGAIHLDSEPGRGTTFHLVIPDIEISARPARRDADEADVSFEDFEPFDVLVVDDNAANRAVIAEFLGGAAREVRFASAGGEAVEAVAREKPDIVLMDLQMRGMDGHQALDHIRRLPGCELLPVLAVTAASLTSNEGGKRWTFDGYVRKPFSRARLYREIAMFVPKRPARSPEFPGHADRFPAARNVVPGDTSGSMPERVIAELCDMEANEWPELCEAMSMSAIRAFALRLVEIGRAHQCALLESFGGQLASHAEDVLVSSVEESLAQFPALVRRLCGAPVTSPP
jgi:CheY-like chemotaxis protein